MKSERTTIYGRYRKAAGMTQEHAAELLGVAVRSLAAWERGETVPPDQRVLAMADIYNAPTICIEHLRFNVAIARDVLPPVPYVQLPQAVCQLCAALRKVQEEHAEDRLLAIAADGRVDELEQAQFVALADDLDDVIAAALALRYAEGGVRAWN
nr:MAG TPA: Helix-turn-helix XRE-family like protein [Caudoviricetes sp.]